MMDVPVVNVLSGLQTVFKSIRLVVQGPDRPGRFGRLVGTFGLGEDLVLTRRVLIETAGCDEPDHVAPIPMRNLAAAEDRTERRHVAEPVVPSPADAVGIGREGRY